VYYILIFIYLLTLSVGEGEGRYHKLNIPLRRYIDDEKFVNLFKSIVTRTIESYRPDVIVM
jgi:acetoin utilization deacetylase AcuC-like enzyme